MSRSSLTAAVGLFAALSLQAEISPPELEEAAEVARRSAAAALRGPQRILLESVETDGEIRRVAGDEAWSGLTERQRDQLRSVVRERFLEALAPPPNVPGEVSWSWARAVGDDSASVFLELQYGTSRLKTRWSMIRRRGGWKVAEVALTDPGISLVEQAARSLGPRPIVRRDPLRQAQKQALPRLAALAAVGLIILLARRRLAAAGRRLLWIAAAAPAFLFAIDGALAVWRALREPYALADSLPTQPWASAQEEALEAERAGRSRQARHHWSRALAAGAPTGPVYYHLGLTAHRAGEAQEARRAFERALRESPPAPGASRELGLMALAEKRNEEAVERLRSYVGAAGPDPETLSALAVAESNLGHSEDAVRAIAEARALVGSDWKGAELEARVRARAGDAPGAVAALRPLEREGRIDRSALRADPVYLPIATDPAWVEFLAETPAVKKTPAPAGPSPRR
jgi:tetratricopeptide (TPR) repeat protein